MGRLTTRIVPGDWTGVAHAISRLDAKLNTGAAPTFSGLTLTGFTGILKASTGVVTSDAVHGDLADAVWANTADHDGRYFTETELGSNVNALGASLIGIEDAMSLYIATNVEAALEEVMDKVTAITYTANSISTDTGTLDSGNVASVQVINDDDTYDVSEVTGSPGFDIVIIYTGISAGHEPNKFQLHLAYDGSVGHVVNFEMWNYTGTPQWDVIAADAITESGGILTFYDIDITGTITDYVSGGEAKLRINHTSSGNINHDVSIDYAVLLDDPTGIGGISDHGSLSGLNDDDHNPLYLRTDGIRAMTGSLDMGSNSLTSVDNITATGIIQAGTLKDGTLTITGGNITDLFSITGDGTVTITAGSNLILDFHENSNLIFSIEGTEVGSYDGDVARWRFKNNVWLGSDSGDNILINDQYYLPQADGTAGFLVATDGDEQWGYTTPTPTSGDWGFWSRTGTLITTKAANDSLTIGGSGRFDKLYSTDATEPAISNSIAFGNGAVASGGGSIAFGANAEANGVVAIALGFGAIADEQESIAIGKNVTVNTAVGGIGIGGTASPGQFVVSGERAIGIGIGLVGRDNEFLVSGVRAVGVGISLTVSAADAIAIGSGFKNETANTLAIGFGSEDIIIDATTIELTKPTNIGDGTNETQIGSAGNITQGGSANAILNLVAKSVAIASLADGTDGELITWSAAGEIDTVAVGTAGHVLTSNGVGVAPTFQVGGGGVSDHALLSNLDFASAGHTGFQEGDAGLTSLAGLTYAAASFVKMTSANTFALRTIGETADDLEGVIDHNSLANTHGAIQPLDAGLTSLAGLAYVSDSFIKVTATDTYAIRTIAETKSDLSLNLVENTALSTWAGTSSITTLGTISAGTWQGTTIAVNQGGTGQVTAQAAINSLSAVSGATNEHVLTKDTGTGNATWKVAAGGGGGGFTDRGDPATVDFAVGDLTTDDNWNNLDLDSIITSDATAVLLRVAIKDDAINKRIRFRKNGLSNTPIASSPRTQVVDVGIDYDIIVSLDANNIIEYQASNTVWSTINIVVKGWWA